MSEDEYSFINPLEAAPESDQTFELLDTDDIPEPLQGGRGYWASLITNVIDNTPVGKAAVFRGINSKRYYGFAQTFRAKRKQGRFQGWMITRRKKGDDVYDLYIAREAEVRVKR